MAVLAEHCTLLQSIGLVLVFGPSDDGVAALLPGAFAALETAKVNVHGRSPFFNQSGVDTIMQVGCCSDGSPLIRLLLL